jgi:NAD(P)-dependent dehydrogenase (short-subunit alcohol dehydrogenase family)
VPLDALATRAALVTGAGSSVGRVIAEQFLAAGARVHIGDVNPQFIERTLGEVRGLSGSVCDVGQSAQIDALFADAQRSIGDIDFLVNCVGIAGPHAAVEDITPEDWRQSIEVNLNGTFELMRRAIPGMKARRAGVIVNFSTASTKTGLPNRTPYVASKAALEALTYTAARELGPFNVRCNAIRPGAINNDRMNKVVERVAAQRGIPVAEVEADFLSHVSMRTKIEPLELAQTVLFLCGPGGAHITGQFIEVSGNLEWEG